jgi:hypothetical protein
VRKIEKNLGLVVSSLQTEVASLRSQLGVYQESLKQSTAMVQDVCGTMRITVQASITRQDSCTRAVLDKLQEQNRIITNMQEQQQQNMLLLIEQIQQQQAGDRATASLLSHQSTVEGGIGAIGDAGNHAGRRKQDDDDDEVGSVSYATKQARKGQALGYNAFKCCVDHRERLVLSDGSPKPGLPY